MTPGLLLLIWKSQFANVRANQVGGCRTRPTQTGARPEPTGLSMLLPGLASFFPCMPQPAGLQGSSRSDLTEERGSFESAAAAKKPPPLPPPAPGGLPVGCPEDPLGEAGQSARLLLVPPQVLAQQDRERAQRLLLEDQPLRLQPTLGDGRLKPKLPRGRRKDAAHTFARASDRRRFIHGHPQRIPQGSRWSWALRRFVASSPEGQRAQLSAAESDLRSARV